MKKSTKRMFFTFAVLVMGVLGGAQAFATCIECTNSSNGGKCYNGGCSSSYSEGAVCCGNTCSGC